MILDNLSNRFRKLDRTPRNLLKLKVGARSVQGLGAKTRIMELMGHSDPDVRYEALSTVQLLMSGQFL
jgi:V-ATPase subunit H